MSFGLVPILVPIGRDRLQFHTTSTRVLPTTTCFVFVVFFRVLFITVRCGNGTSNLHLESCGLMESVVIAVAVAAAVVVVVVVVVVVFVVV